MAPELASPATVSSPHIQMAYSLLGHLSSPWSCKELPCELTLQKGWRPSFISSWKQVAKAALMTIRMANLSCRPLPKPALCRKAGGPISGSRRAPGALGWPHTCFRSPKGASGPAGSLSLCPKEKWGHVPFSLAGQGPCSPEVAV